MNDRDYSIDAYTPKEMAERVSTVGVAKGNLDAATLFMLAVLAGAFIGLGANFATIVWTQNNLEFGPSRLLGGVAFSLGLVLVIIGGAELFTGNNLMVMAWAAGNLSTSLLLRNWIIVYTGNKVLAIVPPITAFVAAGFEHSIANMYFIPLGLLLLDQPQVIQAAGQSAAQMLNLTWVGFLKDNLFPVTLGNLVGGTFMVAGVYWFVYLRGHEETP